MSKNIVIGNSNPKVIKKALKANTAATSLSILSCNVSYEEAKAIAEILKENHTLTSVDLSFNNIGYKGAKLIAEALKENHTLTSINLSFNNISYKGVKLIAEALKKNHTLTSVNLGSEQHNNTCNDYISRNKMLVKKLADFLFNNFVKENVPSLEKSHSLLKHYQVADKRLLEEYIKELTDTLPSNAPDNHKNKVKKLSTRIESFINDNYFNLDLVCKAHKDQTNIISLLPKEVRSYITSFLNPHSLWNETNNDFEMETSLIGLVA